MPANRDGGSGQFFENPPSLAFPADDSAVNSSDLCFILSEEVVKIDDIQGVVLAEEPERALGGKPPPNCENYILGLKCSRGIGRIRFYSDLDSTRWTVYLKIHKELLFYR